MSDIVVRRVMAEEQYPLRRLVLGQGDVPAKPGDDDPETYHVAVLKDGDMVTIASVYHEPPQGVDEPFSWRLRGMGTLPDEQGSGYGRLALEHCLSYVRSAGGTRLWCNAREGAVSFYTGMGFQLNPEGYEVPGFGKRFFMWLDLDPAEADEQPLILP